MENSAMKDRAIKLICDDVMDALETVRDESVDFIMTSPPYNLGFDYGITIDDSKHWREYYHWCRLWLWECFRVLKPDGRMVLMHYFSCGNGQERETPLMYLSHMMTREMPFKHHAVIFWLDRTVSKRTAWGSWLSASAPYISSPLEGMLVCYKDQWKKQTKGKTQIEKDEFMQGCLGIWEISPEKGAKRDHPAPFPFELADRAIRLLTYEGDTVVDPFCGRGTLLWAAAISGRNGIGIDVNPTYIALAAKTLTGMGHEPEV